MAVDTVKNCTPDDGCVKHPKHVECCSKIKWTWDIVHLVGFTIKKWQWSVFSDSTRTIHYEWCTFTYKTSDVTVQWTAPFDSNTHTHTHTHTHNEKWYKNIALERLVWVMFLSGRFTTAIVCVLQLVTLSDLRPVHVITQRTQNLVSKTSPARYIHANNNPSYTHANHKPPYTHANHKPPKLYMYMFMLHLHILMYFINISM